MLEEDSKIKEWITVVKEGIAEPWTLNAKLFMLNFFLVFYSYNGTKAFMGKLFWFLGRFFEVVVKIILGKV